MSLRTINNKWVSYSNMLDLSFGDRNICYHCYLLQLGLPWRPVLSDKLSSFVHHLSRFLPSLSNWHMAPGGTEPVAVTLCPPHSSAWLPWVLCLVCQLAGVTEQPGHLLSSGCFTARAASACHLLSVLWQECWGSTASKPRICFRSCYSLLNGTDCCHHQLKIVSTSRITELLTSTLSLLKNQKIKNWRSRSPAVKWDMQ